VKVVLTGEGSDELLAGYYPTIGRRCYSYLWDGLPSISTDGIRRLVRGAASVPCDSISSTQNCHRDVSPGETPDVDALYFDQFCADVPNVISGGSVFERSSGSTRASKPPTHLPRPLTADLTVASARRNVRGCNKILLGRDDLDLHELLMKQDR